MAAYDAEETWEGYLSGQFGVCLWDGAIRSAAYGPFLIQRRG